MKSILILILDSANSVVWSPTKEGGGRGQSGACWRKGEVIEAITVWKVQAVIVGYYFFHHYFALNKEMHQKRHIVNLENVPFSLKDTIYKAAKHLQTWIFHTMDIEGQLFFRGTGV